MKLDEKWDEIRNIHREHELFYRLVLIGLLALVGRAFFYRATGYDTNLFTEMISIIITVLVINYGASLREERREIERLVLEATGYSSEFAKTAIRKLKAKRLTQGDRSVLKNASGIGANLEGCHLGEVNMSGSKLFKASLVRAILYRTNLSNADLQEATLSYAKANWANFSEAKLINCDLANGTFDSADFFDAKLNKANLEGADLRDADLTDAILEDIKISKKTFLPDRTYYSSSTDLKRFTDPTHPEYWRSSDPDSPAKNTRT